MVYGSQLMVDGLRLTVCVLMLLGEMEKVRRVRMRRDALGFFKALIESYEEVALVTVLDSRRGEVEIIYPFSFESTLQAIMEDMASFSILIQEVDHAADDQE